MSAGVSTPLIGGSNRLASTSGTNGPSGYMPIRLLYALINVLDIDIEYLFVSLLSI